MSKNCFQSRYLTRMFLEKIGTKFITSHHTRVYRRLQLHVRLAQFLETETPNSNDHMCNGVKVCKSRLTQRQIPTPWVETLNTLRKNKLKYIVIIWLHNSNGVAEKKPNMTIV